MRVSVVQLSPGTDPATNRAEMARVVREACRADRPELVILPEMWSCLGGGREEKMAASERLPERKGADPDEAASTYRLLSVLAASERIVLHGGSIGEWSGERLRNTSLVFGPDGEEIARYRKIHLFDTVTPSGVVYRESDLYEPGQEVVCFALPGGMKVGCAICYDLRFPALFAALRQRGADLIVLPAAFTVETGLAHWEPLLRARAIETQCWVAAAATTGTHLGANGEARHTFGHSLICDPWGTIVAQASGGTGWTTATVDPSLTARIRCDMPVWSHRKNLA